MSLGKLLSFLPPGECRAQVRAGRMWTIPRDACDAGDEFREAKFCVLARYFEILAQKVNNWRLDFACERLPSTPKRWRGRDI